MTKLRTTFRYVIRIGPRFVHGGLTDDLERSKNETQTTWPTGQFFQVGEKTTLDEARAWAIKNAFITE